MFSKEIIDKVFFGVVKITKIPFDKNKNYKIYVEKNHYYPNNSVVIINNEDYKQSSKTEK